MTLKFNPAFEYVQDKYDINCNVYRNLSSVIHNHSIAASNEFAKIIGMDSNDDLAHFFFDYFLCQFTARRPEDFYNKNNDAYSAIIDGLHIEFYGNASDEVIESILDLWVTKTKCFLQTIIKSFKNREIGASLIFMIDIASHCAGKTRIGATDSLKWAKLFIPITSSKLSSIDTFYKISMNQ